MRERFVQPIQGEQVASEYDFPSDTLADLIARDVAPFDIITLDLSVAQTTHKVIRSAGRAFVPYGYTTGDAIKSPKDILINVQKETNNAPTFPAKHNRGQTGLFERVLLTWSAQAGLSCDFVVLKSDRKPWMEDFIAPVTPTALPTPFQELPTGLINNSNTTFSLSHAPIAASLVLYQDGLALVQGAGKDYTISGSTITMTVAPNFGQELYAVYTY